MFTTHKLYYASRADRILYMEDGAVKENGSHKELMQRGGGYAALYTMQAKELFAQEGGDNMGRGVIRGGAE